MSVQPYRVDRRVLGEHLPLPDGRVPAARGVRGGRARRPRRRRLRGHVRGGVGQRHAPAYRRRAAAQRSPRLRLGRARRPPLRALVVRPRTTSCCPSTTSTSTASRASPATTPTAPRSASSAPSTRMPSRRARWAWTTPGTAPTPPTTRPTPRSRPPSRASSSTCARDSRSATGRRAPGGRRRPRPSRHPRPRRSGRMGAGQPCRASSLAASTRLADAEPPIALGALDGRYRGVVAPLVDHLSEAALNRERVHVEVEWLIHLTEHEVVPGVRRLTTPRSRRCATVVDDFGAAEVDELAEIERVTQHDVKAVEYFVKKRLTAIAPDERRPGLAELIHFGVHERGHQQPLVRLMVKGAVQEVWLPRATALVDAAWPTMASRPARRAAARAHPRPARDADDDGQGARRARAPPPAPARAASTTPSSSASSTAPPAPTARTSPPCPSADWQAVCREFVEGLGLTWNPLTTQIESHDWQAELYADVARFNRVLHNLCTDVWTYISMGYFAQVRGQGTVGSLDDAAQGQPDPLRERRGQPRGEQRPARRARRARSCRAACSATSPTRSMQRNIGSAFGHTLLAIDNVARGLAGLDAVPERDGRRPRRQLGGARRADPVGDARPRRAGVPGMEEPYERLKELTRGRRIGRRRAASSSCAGSGCRPTSRPVSPR